MYQLPLRDRVTLVHRVKDARGTESDGATIEARACVQRGQHRAKSKKGETITARVMVFVEARAAISPTDGAWLIREDGNEYHVVSIDEVRDPRSNQRSHWEILGK